MVLVVLAVLLYILDIGADHSRESLIRYNTRSFNPKIFISCTKFKGVATYIGQTPLSFVQLTKISDFPN